MYSLPLTSYAAYFHGEGDCFPRKVSKVDSEVGEARRRGLFAFSVADTISAIGGTWTAEAGFGSRFAVRRGGKGLVLVFMCGGLPMGRGGSH